MFEALIGIGGGAGPEGVWAQLSVSAGPTLRTNGCGLGLDGKFYLFGGYNSSTYYRDLRCYDDSTGLWALLINATLPIRHQAVMVAMGGKIYVHGGINSGGALADTWVYDPALNTWVQKLTGNPRYAGAATAVDNKMYVCGGWTSTYASDLKVYDADANTWTTLSSLPAGGRLDHTLVVVGTKLYLYGGLTSSPFNDHWCYDTLTDTWTQLADGPSARSRHTAVVIDGKIYYFGGRLANATNTKEVWCYDPVEATWTASTPHPGAGRAEHAAGVVNGKMFISEGATPIDCWQFTP